jgi:hypothetical protein
MPTPVHDFFTSSVALEIYKQLQSIANGESAASKFAKQIQSGGSSRIFLKDGDSGDETAVPRTFPHRQPDAQFQYPCTAYPGIVLEVSYSQNGKDLQKLARDYILQSNGDIKVVIGFNINYGETEESSVSLWRPLYIQEKGEEYDMLDVQQEIKNEVSAPSPFLINHLRRSAEFQSPFELRMEYM